MSLLIAILALSANPATPPSKPEAGAAQNACRDAQGSFRLHCLPKGTVTPAPGSHSTIRNFPRDPDKAKVPAKPTKQPQ